MTDTQDYIYKIQYNIIAQKPMTERIALGMESIDSVRQMIRQSIIVKNPKIDKPTLEKQLFLHCYANDFSPILLQKIANDIYCYHKIN